VSERDRASPNLVLAVLSLAALTYAVLSSSVVPALPTIQHELHATETGVSWLLSGFLLSASAATSIIGRLGDMYGKDRALLWTLVVLAAGTLLAALSHTLALLIVARVIQGTSGGLFPLAMGVVRDEFPRHRVAGGIGIISATMGVGGGLGIVGGAIVIEHLSYHWLFWIPLGVIIPTALLTWRFVPPSPVRVPGRIDWLPASLMVMGITDVLLALTMTATWGWVSLRTLGLMGAGLLACVAWVAAERRSPNPIVDMNMMKIRGVWTTNAVAFLLGAGMYSSFFIIPQIAQLPKSTGFGFGASVVDSGLYLLPSTGLMFAVSMLIGRMISRSGARPPLLAGICFTTASFAMLSVAHRHPYDIIIATCLLGIGMGLAFAALGALVVAAVPPEQTGVATGMNTVMRTLGGALGGQISATMIAAHVARGEPLVTGFTDTFIMATGFLIVCLGAGLLIPTERERTPAPARVPRRRVLARGSA
jgi:MFS family permease